MQLPTAPFSGATLALHEPSLKLLLSVTTTLPVEEYTVLSEETTPVEEYTVLSEETTPVEEYTLLSEVLSEETTPVEEYTLLSEVLSEETTPVDETVVLEEVSVLDNVSLEDEFKPAELEEPVDDITEVVDVGLVEVEMTAYNSGSRHNTPPPVNKLDNGQAQTIHETQTTN